MNQIQKMNHEAFLEILQELNATIPFGEATKIIREKIDKNFGKIAADKKQLYEVKLEGVIRETEYKTYKVEAWSEEEASEQAAELMTDNNDYDEVEVIAIKEIK